MRRHVLGLIGYGAIGKEDAARAVPFGLSVLAFDPFVHVADTTVTQVETLRDLSSMLTSSRSTREPPRRTRR